MNDSELTRRVSGLSPLELSKLKSILTPPVEKVSSSKVEKVPIHVPYQDCESCVKMTVSQNVEDYHLLENSCPRRQNRKWDEGAHRWRCDGWGLRRKRSSEGEEGEE